jgi:starch synthase
MAMKKAVVATRVDGIPEMVEHGSTGLLVPPGDSADLASSIIELLRDPAQAARMGEMGRMRVEEEFELNARVLSEIKIYEDYLAGNR